MPETPSHVCSNCGSPLPVSAPGTIERCKFCGAEVREAAPVEPFDPAKLNASPKPMLAIVAGLVGALVLALVLLLTMSSRASRSGPAPRTRINLTLGGQSVALVPTGSGYDVQQDGRSRDRVKIEGDRVKVEDASGQQAAEVKRKDYGFKVYDAHSVVVVEGKRAGAGWKIKRADGSEIVKLTSTSDEAIAAIGEMSEEERLGVVAFLHEGGS